MITHLFFDLNGILVDESRLTPCYTLHLGSILAARYGPTPEVWQEAHRRVLADWDSYYADLDLGGDDGIAHLWEGLFRTTRALFRLTGTPEPPHPELIALSRELPEQAARCCDALYPDVKPVIEQLCRAGYVPGIASHAISGQARGLLEGGGALKFFTGPVVGPDVTGHFLKDRQFFAMAAHLAGAPPEHCLMVDDNADDLRAARAAGMMTLHLRRMSSGFQSTPASGVLDGDLYSLVDTLKHN